MATTDVEKLLVRLEANLTQYERAFAKAQGVTVSSMRKIEREVQASATRVEGSFAKMGNTFKNFGKGLLVGVGLGSAGALGDFVQSTISQTAKLGDLADKLGLGTDALQAIQYGAVQADMSFEDLEKTLLRFSKTLGQAANGQGDYLKTLRANNQQLQGSYLGNLQQLADLVAHAKNEQEGLLIVSQAMGKGSDGMLEFLRGGSAGLQQLVRDLDGTGSKIDETLIRKAQVIDDRWAALMLSLSNMTKTGVLAIAAELNKIPELNEVAAERAKKPRRMGRYGYIYEGQVGGPPSAPVKEPVAGSGQEMGRPPVGTNFPVTKVSNPEEEAEKARLAAEKAAAAKKKLADAAREAKRAEDELTNSIERQFEAFTGDLTRTDEEIAAMRLEAATLGLSTAEIERQRMAQELLNAANQAGIPITAGLNAVIQDKARAYGEAAQALEDMHELQAAVEDRDAALKDSIKSFASDMRAGIDPIEAMNDALGRLADRLTDLALDMALNSLFKPGGTGGAIGGSGGMGLMPGALFAKGGVMSSRGSVPLRRYAGGGVANSPQLAMFGEGRRPEAYVPLPDGRSIPVKMQMPNLDGIRGRRGGGGMNVVINDYAGVAIQTEKRKDQFGRDELYLAIDQRIADPYSGASAAMSARGAKNPIKRR